MPVLLFCPEAVVPDSDMADYSVIIAYYDGNERWIAQGTSHDIFEVYERHEITHWMPLPKAPGWTSS
jgi:hypothetical protein